jgi:hypothetical protein
LFSLEGTHQAGLRAAARALAVQLPLIAAEFPEVAGCQPGTINLLLNCRLLVATPDHRMCPIPWHPDVPAGKVFDLLRIELEAPAGAEAVQAWLYIPHGSPHRRDLRLHEVPPAFSRSCSSSRRCASRSSSGTGGRVALAGRRAGEQLRMGGGAHLGIPAGGRRIPLLVHKDSPGNGRAPAKRPGRRSRKSQPASRGRGRAYAGTTKMRTSRSRGTGTARGNRGGRWTSASAAAASWPRSSAGWG